MPIKVSTEHKKIIPLKIFNCLAFSVYHGGKFFSTVLRKKVDINSA